MLSFKERWRDIQISVLYIERYRLLEKNEKEETILPQRTQIKDITNNIQYK